MRQHTPLLLVVLGVSCCGLAAAQYNDELNSDNGIPWRGTRGPIEFCPMLSENYTLTSAIDFKFLELGHLDDIGGNGVKLFCRDGEGATRGYITSLEGRNGDWQGIRSCPMGHYFNGFRLRVFPNEGTFGDDFAVDNIQMSCSDGTIVDGLEGVLRHSQTSQEEENEVGSRPEKGVVRKWVETMGRKIEVVRQRLGISRIHGEWGTWAYCSPDLYVGGIQTVVEEGHVDDDAGLTDVSLFCL